ncbi:hypothetical protein FNV43_RR26173 [Rhamnella rubrinervis]|uniref:Uncharacterized protein n=1 Tax=Rhamnella rubrinervis TaxID=2594499 RepID=A0A8K0GJD9_9ROSA|nr:hypothetical protein FNV43_RR26173 [Rhamnella rubrinervis]
MGSYTCNAERTSSVSPQRLFKALVLDADNPTALRAPRKLKETEGLELSRRVLDSDGMENTMEKIVYEIKMVPSGGGPTIKSARTYHTKGDH